MNGGLSGSQLMGGDTDWLRAIGAYNGALPSDQPGTTFADDYALRAAENAFPFTAPIPQVVVNANLTLEQRIASKFGINSYSWAGPAQVDASPFEFRSLFGDAYRNAAHEAFSAENSWGVRAGYAASAAVLALPGLANDMARDVLNSPGRIYGGIGTMSAGIKARDPYQLSSGLMNTSVGILGLAGSASVMRSAVLANVSVGNYAASQATARSTYTFSPPIGNTARPLMSSADMLGVEPASQELISAVAQKRSIAWATPGSEEERLLKYFGAEASVSSNELGEQGMSIILKPNPSKPAVLEEFLHGTQHRLGLPDQFGTEWSEVHVKSFMLRHQDMLGIGAEDASILRTLLQRDIGDLNVAKAAQPNKYFKPIALPPGL